MTASVVHKVLVPEIPVTNDPSKEFLEDPALRLYNSLNFFNLQVLEAFFKDGLKAEPGVAKANNMLKYDEIWWSPNSKSKEMEKYLYNQELTS